MQYLLSAREMKQIDKNTIEVFGSAIPCSDGTGGTVCCGSDKKGNSRLRREHL